MKILSCTQQKEADAYTIEHDSILSINLMEKAASLITEAICRRWNKSKMEQITQDSSIRRPRQQWR